MPVLVGHVQRFYYKMNTYPYRPVGHECHGLLPGKYQKDSCSYWSPIPPRSTVSVLVVREIRISIIVCIVILGNLAELSALSTTLRAVPLNPVPNLDPIVATTVASVLIVTVALKSPRDIFVGFGHDSLTRLPNYLLGLTLITSCPTS